MNKFSIKLLALLVSKMALTSVSYASEYVNVTSFSEYNRNKENTGAAADRSIAIGGNAYVDYVYGSGSIAIGENASASSGNSVALGQNSISENAVSTSEIEINGKIYKFAGGVASGTVSIGGKSNQPQVIGELIPIEYKEPVIPPVYNVEAIPLVDERLVSGISEAPIYSPSVSAINSEVPIYVFPSEGANNKETRTITNVAAGRISATSTDAVNGSQLYAVIDSLSSITASAGGKGEKGERGEQGLKGDKGERGEQGLQGLKGDKGERGEQGLQGLKGDKGERGEQGLQGLKGDKGERGEQGLQGLKGDKGERGEQGLQGLKGDKGERGEQGLQGLKGDKGERGEQGLQGLKGDKGERGEQGLQGLKGDKGDKGERGDSALVDVKAGNNISLKAENHPNGYRSFTVSTADNVSFNSIKVNNLEINQAGINAGNQRITQVADGINDTDVVNIRQLRKVKNYVEETAQEIRNVKGQLHQMNKELRAGMAGASALGMLQASSGAGKSALSASVANYKGQSAVAVGYARSSDNNQVHIKLGAGINSVSDVNLGGSVGLHW